MAREWKYSVLQKELVEAAVVAVRTSDNVLDEEDWPIHVLKFNEKGICIQQIMENKGVYKFDDFVGKNLNELYEWFDYDMDSSWGDLSHDLCVLAYP